MQPEIAKTQTANNTAWQQFSVEFQYPVTFTEDLFNVANLTLLDSLTRLEPSKQHRAAVFIDEGVINAIPNLISNINAYFHKYNSLITLAGPPIVMPAGEGIKTHPAHVSHMQEIVAQQRIDRHSFIIGIGGGALLDAVGLVAATAHRGIRHIRIPTTVLAQNDSGVGVKNGVNLFDQKNYFGTFSPPFAVINDYCFIESLLDRDKIAGMAEAVKVALIRDVEFFHWLEENAHALSHFEKSPMLYMIRRCAELHMHQIASGGDPFESGSARPLDFGHWSAHRLESLTNYTIRHGEAVAIGIALDARYSVLTARLPAGCDERICQLLNVLGFELYHPQLGSMFSSGKLNIVEGLNEFKEHLGGELTITLLERIGVGQEVNEMDENIINQSVEWLARREVNGHLLAAPADINDKKTQANRLTIVRPSAQVKQIFSTIEGTNDLNQQATIAHLNSWIKERTSQKNFDWLKARLRLLDEEFLDRNLYITLGLIPRKLGQTDLALKQKEIKAVARDCGRNWDPTYWSIDTAARCLVIATLQQQQAGKFQKLFKELCKSAELKESIAFYQCTSVLYQHDDLDTVVGSGLRTHISAIFEAIAHRNPYPQMYFTQNRWNHMVLKALFIESELWPIQGIDERANAELAIILCDYAHERWAAHRRVTPELWRCVGPYAHGTMLQDLYRALDDPEEISQQAALLALMACPEADHAELTKAHPSWAEDIKKGIINWRDIGQRANQVNQ
jgi:3-dehydroquinate synthase